MAKSNTNRIEKNLTFELKLKDGEQATLKLVAYLIINQKLPEQVDPSAAQASGGNKEKKKQSGISDDKTDPAASINKFGVYENLGNMYRCEKCARVYWQEEVRYNNYLLGFV